MRKSNIEKLSPVSSPTAIGSSTIFRYVIQRAFVTTPLSYLLEKQAPHGVLEKLYVSLNWTTDNSNEFQSSWKRFKKESISNYVEDVIIELVSRRIFCFYPLIFSTTFVKVLFRR
jgi:hypothetical protein